ncbi:MAG: hypothetical protein KAR83_07110 [Thermodesulfovibrionales bacterium]|nr:hypothetical protein [Thermodesulfovibrionales bacterium]
MKIKAMPIPQLPKHLRFLQNKIESMSGTPIIWNKSNSLEGMMSSNLDNNNPIIHYQEFTEAGAAEEMLHLELTLSGIPKLSCKDHLNISKQVALRLAIKF